MLFPSTAHIVATVTLIVSLLTIGLSGAAAEDHERPGHLTPPELYKVAENSKKTYTILTADEDAGLDVDDFAELFWPSMGDATQYPWIDTEDGSRSLSPYELGEPCLEKLSKAEPFFKNKRYKKAMKLYSEAIEESPRCYVAYSHVGDCHYFQGQAEEALPWYDKVLALNPHDFLGYFYRANTLVRLDRYDEARDAYVQALSMKPHRESILKAVRARSQDLGIRVVDSPFRPQAFARQEKDGIAIYVSPGAAHWLAYGLCKAIWIGEASHREERTGNREHVWSLVEERQCLTSMLENYYALREDDTIDADPETERLLSILKDEMLDGFVMYEIASRLHPHTMLLLPEEMFADVVDYVRTHVLVSDHEGGSSTTAREER